MSEKRKSGFLENEEDTSFEASGGTSEKVGLVRALSDLAKTAPDKLTLLSAEEERDLGTRAILGDIEARNELVTRNLRFVILAAKKYKGAAAKNGVPFEDMEHEGVLELLKAAETFDPARGYRFLTYAGWLVRRAMLKYLNGKGGIVKHQRVSTEIDRKFSEAEKFLLAKSGREPSHQELKEHLMMTDQEFEKARIIRESRSAPTSLDKTYGEDEDLPLLDFLLRKNLIKEDGFLDADSKEVLETGLNELTEKERTTLRLSFGLDERGPMTQEEIGRRWVELGFGKKPVTRQRVEQIVKEGLLKLKIKLKSNEGLDTSEESAKLLLIATKKQNSVDRLNKNIKDKNK